MWDGSFMWVTWFLEKALVSLGIFLISFFFFYDFIYLSMRDTERGRDTGRGRSRLPSGSPMQDSIPKPRGHDLSQSQMLNR